MGKTIEYLSKNLKSLYESLSAFGQRINQETSFRWFVVSCILLIIGLGFTFYSASADVDNIIRLTYKTKSDVFDVILTRPILSNNQVQLDPPWTTIRTLISTVGAVALIIAFPQLLIFYFVFLAVSIKENLSNGIHYIITSIVAIVLLCCPLTTLLPATWRQALTNIVVTPTPTTLLPTPTPLPDQVMSYAYIDVKAPPYLEQGQSQVIELKFALLDKYVAESIPVYLKNSDVYSVTVEIQLTSFDLASQSKDTLENRSVRINNPVKWNWVILPKKDVEGRQAIAWVVKIQDGSSPTYSDLSTVHIDLDIKPRLGIPSWWLGRDWTLFTTGTTIAGIVSTFYAFKKKADEKQIGKKRSKRR